MRTADENKRAAVAYEAAYSVVPRQAHAEPEEFASEFIESPDLAALFLYTVAAKNRGVKPPPEDVGRVRGHTARLDADREVYVIQYPTFPAVDLVATGGLTPAGLSPYVLAPYFSAVVVDEEAREVACFVLGQSPDARTTLRSVTPEMNTNLGPGCEPLLGPFLTLVRTRIKR